MRNQRYVRLHVVIVMAAVFSMGLYVKSDAQAQTAPFDEPVL